MQIECHQTAEMAEVCHTKIIGTQFVTPYIYKYVSVCNLIVIM